MMDGDLNALMHLIGSGDARAAMKFVSGLRTSLAQHMERIARAAEEEYAPPQVEYGGDEPGHPGAGGHYADEDELLEPDHDEHLEGDFDEPYPEYPEFGTAGCE
jgi:hypothetical protein